MRVCQLEFSSSSSQQQQQQQPHPGMRLLTDEINISVAEKHTNTCRVNSRLVWQILRITSLFQKPHGR